MAGMFSEDFELKLFLCFFCLVLEKLERPDLSNYNLVLVNKIGTGLETATCIDKHFDTEKRVLFLAQKWTILCHKKWFTS